MKKPLFFFAIGLCFLGCEKNEINQPVHFLDNITIGNVTSVLTLGGSLNDVAQSVTATKDNGYLIAGYTQSDDGDIENKTNTSFDYWLIKFNQNHEIEWKKTIGGSGDDRARKVIQTLDGNFVVIGYSDSADGNVSQNNGLRDFWIVKLDALGTMLWEKSFGFSGNDEGINIKESIDGSLFAVGLIDITASGGQGNIGKFQSNHAGGDYWVLKLTATGDLVWARFFGGSFTDTAFDIEINSLNEVVVIGSSDSVDSDISNNKGSYDFWLVKLNNNGDLIWEKSFGGTEIDEGRSLVKTVNGHLLIGDTRSSDLDVTSNNGGADIWVSEIDTSGNILRSNTIGGSDFDVARSVIISRDNNYILTGSSRSSNFDVSLNKGQNDAWVLKIDGNGSLLWETTVGGSNIDFVYQSTQLNDGTIISVGETDSNDFDIVQNKGFTDVLIITIQ